VGVHVIAFHAEGELGAGCGYQGLGGCPRYRDGAKESGACVKNRFTARVSMIEEPGAGKPHAGICAGGVG
jgi:hypothetical protein